MARTTGGESLNLTVKEQCTPGTLDPTVCNATGTGGTVGDLPVDVAMTDNGDGTYSHTLTTEGNPNAEATVSLYISTVTGGGLVGDYYQDIDRTGPIFCKRIENPNQDWGVGNVACTG